VRKELVRRDPDFIVRVEKFMRRSKAAPVPLDAPNSRALPVSSNRLSKKAHDLLEAALDIRYTTQMFAAAADEIVNFEQGADPIDTGLRLALRAENWHIWANAVAIKLHRVAVMAVRYGYRERADAPVAKVEELYKRELVEIEEKTRVNRDPALHGIGQKRGRGVELRPAVRGVTEDGLWEFGVAIEMPADYTDESRFARPERLKKWRVVFPAMTDIVNTRVEALVSEVVALIEATPESSG
jgi:hypothetical protein